MIKSTKKPGSLPWSQKSLYFRLESKWGKMSGNSIRNFWGTSLFRAERNGKERYPKLLQITAYFQAETIMTELMIVL